MNTNLRPLSPFQDFCVKFLGYVPSSYDDCMTYLECLIYTYNYLKNEIVPTVNTQNTVIQEMKDYIDNYFTNLDVQEEINNKLDDMVLQGTLQEIITEYIQLKGMLAFNSVADMKIATNLVDGSFVRTYGFHNVNDGGGAYYKIRNITNQDVVNEMSIIALNDENLIAELIKNNVNVKQYGAKGDDTNDDTLAIQTCIDENLIVYIPTGTYKTTNSINISNNSQKIYGNGTTLSIIKKYGTTSYGETISYNTEDYDYSEHPTIIALIFSTDTNLSHIEINNMLLLSDTNGGNDGIIAPHISYCKFEKIRTNKCNMAFRVGGWINKIYNCEILSNVDEGIYIKDGIYYVISGVHARSVAVRNGKGIYINNSAFDNGNPCFTITDSQSVYLTNCSTETYKQVLRNNNSYVNIYGCDLEAHSSGATSNFQGFFDNTNGGITNISNCNIHYEDYNLIGNPDNKNIVQNAGGNVTLLNNNITTPYTRKNYLTGSSTIKENEKVESTIPTVWKKTGTFSITPTTSNELLRLPFVYGQGYNFKIKGWGYTEYREAINTECIMSATASGSSSNVSDNVDIVETLPTGASFTAYLQLIKEENEIVLYYKSGSARSNSTIYFDIDYWSNT